MGGRGPRGGQVQGEVEKKNRPDFYNIISLEDGDRFGVAELEEGGVAHSDTFTKKELGLH